MVCNRKRKTPLPRGINNCGDDWPFVDCGTMARAIPKRNNPCHQRFRCMCSSHWIMDYCSRNLHMAVELVRHIEIQTITKTFVVCSRYGIDIIYLRSREMKRADHPLHTLCIFLLTCAVLFFSKKILYYNFFWRKLDFVVVNRVLVQEEVLWKQFLFLLEDRMQFVEWYPSRSCDQ